jgi:hypothetical protein
MFRRVEIIESSKELMEYISKTNRDHSVVQFSIQGKGKFTLVLQKVHEPSIEEDIEENPYLLIYQFFITSKKVK